MIEPITQIVGTGLPMWHANIDTDQIMPKQFLKRIERSGFGPFVFYDWRRDGDSILDDPIYAGAKVLVAGDNFGCGSSREQAVWGLQNYGFDAVVAPSFAPIFRENAARCRFLTVEIPSGDCKRLADEVRNDPETTIHIDLEAQRLTAAGVDASFDLDKRTRQVFLHGIDEIEQTLLLDAAVTAHEANRPSWLPTTGGRA